MIDKFVIWVEDQFGHTTRAFTWRGIARDGIARAKEEARAKGQHRVDVWATPIANKNEVDA
jgi:hypothetical protein